MWKSFSRSQLAALAATVADFGLLTLWVEVFGLFYAYGVPVGAFAGAVTSFLINRHWSFEAGKHPVAGQAFRYTIVSAGSLALNTTGVYALTEGFGFHYLISKTAVALTVGFFYNYPLHRYFVYEHQPHATQKPEALAPNGGPRTPEPRPSRP